jgi:hypothetical protein
MTLSNIKWIATALCLLGIALTSFNIFPLNILFGLIGSGLWTAAGYMQDDAPLVVVELVATALYAFGLVTYITLEISKWI